MICLSARYTKCGFIPTRYKGVYQVLPPYQGYFHEESTSNIQIYMDYVDEDLSNWILQLDLDSSTLNLRTLKKEVLPLHLYYYRSTSISVTAGYLRVSQVPSIHSFLTVYVGYQYFFLKYFSLTLGLSSYGA